MCGKVREVIALQLSPESGTLELNSFFSKEL